MGVRHQNKFCLTALVGSKDLEATSLFAIPSKWLGFRLGVIVKGEFGGIADSEDVSADFAELPSPEPSTEVAPEFLPL